LTSIYADKSELSGFRLATHNLDSDIADNPLDITRAELEAAVADSLKRIRSRIDDVFRLAGLTPEAVSAVFLTGGATRMPSVRSTIAGAVPAARLIAGDAFGSVATGLALDAAKRFAERDK